jgi:hypothetical protein
MIEKVSWFDLITGDCKNLLTETESFNGDFI